MAAPDTQERFDGVSQPAGWTDRRRIVVAEDSTLRWQTADLPGDTHEAHTPTPGVACCRV
jgi:hypothetical protein